MNDLPHNGRELTHDELTRLPMQAILVRLGLVTLDQLAEALRENVATGRTVEEIAVSRGWVDADLVARLRAMRGESAPPEPAPPPVALAPDPVAPAPVTAVPPPVLPVPTPIAPAPAVAAYEPIAPAPPPAPAAPAAAAPVPTSEPVAPAANGAPATVGVFLNLEGGQRLWVGRFPTEEEGRRKAQELIDSMVRPEPGVWPRFGNRLVRPSAVIGVEISKRRED